jgi:hypothetical protein
MRILLTLFCLLFVTNAGAMDLLDACFGEQDAGGTGYNVSLISSSELTFNGTTDDCTPPTGIQDDDMIVAFVIADNGAQTITPPSGFTKIDDINPGSACTMESYYKEASSESGDYTWSVGSSDDVIVHMLLFRKAAGTSWTTPTTAGYHSEKISNTASTTSTSVTTQNESVLAIAWGNNSAFNASTPPATMIEAEGVVYNSALSQFSYTEYFETGAATTRTFVWDDTNYNGALAVVLYAN